MRISCFLFLILFLYHSQASAQINLVNKKGTVLSIDSSKWTLSDSNIYNKNTGTVGIGTKGTANSNAALEIKASDKGLLIPRLALTGAAAASPLAAHVAGMLVYNTATAGTAPNNVSPGFYFNNGTKWVKVSEIVQADTTNDSWKEDAANTLVKLAYQSNGATVRSAGTEFVIKDDGKVGIGTSAPVATLHVKNGDFRLENEGNWNAYKGVTYSDSQYPQLFLYKARGTKLSPSYPLSGNTMGVFRVTNAIDSAGGAGFRISATESQTAASQGSSLTVFTTPNGSNSNSDVFIVDQNGNTGIGTTSPAEKLHVQTNLVSNFLGVANFLAPNNTTSGNRAMLRLGVASTNKNSAEYRFRYFSSGNDSNSMDFSFNGISNPLMSIQAGGNVGIATSSPAYKLHVAGQIHADSTVSAPNYTASVQSTATGSSYTWNMNLGANTAWTLAAGANTLSISNAKAGMFGLIKVTNAGTSTITLPAGSKVINGGAGAIPLTQVASAVDILTFYYDGTNYWWTYGNNYN